MRTKFFVELLSQLGRTGLLFTLEELIILPPGSAVNVRRGGWPAQNVGYTSFDPVRQEATVHIDPIEIQDVSEYENVLHELEAAGWEIIGLKF